MRRVFAGVVVGVLGIGLTVGTGSPAQANVTGEPGDTAGGISQPNTWPDLSEPGAKEDRAQAEAKLALSEAFLAAASGTTSNARAATSLEQLLAQYQATFGTDALSEKLEAEMLESVQASASSSADFSASAEGLPERTLDMKQYAQAKSYYCGPAAAQAVLKSAGFGDSADSGLNLTQANLARDEYLSTEKNNATTWDSFRMRKGMNRWRGDSYFVEKPSPTPAEFKSEIGLATFSKQGGTVDAVEFEGGEHYNNHPRDREIGHWTAIYGHTAEVVSVKLVDPSHSDAVSWGNLPDEKFRYNATQFANKFVAYNGVVY